MLASIPKRQNMFAIEEGDDSGHLESLPDPEGSSRLKP